MKLTHFTGATQLPFILGYGALITTDSRIGVTVSVEFAVRHGLRPIGTHVGPDVVWLTSSEVPDSTATTDGPGGRKGDIRVEVDVPQDEAFHWPEWSREQGIHPKWYDILGFEADPESWWVVPRDIPHTEWVAIERTSKPSRNSRCYCGSGLKSKRCHLPRQTPLWTPEAGIERKYTRREAMMGGLHPDALGTDLPWAC
jgi:hypothetical protein